jgi:hypothetical protein
MMQWVMAIDSVVPCCFKAARISIIGTIAIHRAAAVNRGKDLVVVRELVNTIMAAVVVLLWHFSGDDRDLSSRTDDLNLRIACQF